MSRRSPAGRVETGFAQSDVDPRRLLRHRRVRRPAADDRPARAGQPLSGERASPGDRGFRHRRGRRPARQARLARRRGLGHAGRRAADPGGLRPGAGGSAGGPRLARPLDRPDGGGRARRDVHRRRLPGGDRDRGGAGDRARGWCRSPARPWASCWREHRFLTVADIPGDTYPGIEAGTPTLGVAALWVVAAELDEELVYEITRALWHPDTLAKLAEGHPKGAEILLANALRGVVDPAPSRCRPLLPRAGPGRVSLVDVAHGGRREPAEPAIVVDGLAKSYGAVTAVAGLSFAVGARPDRGAARPQRCRQDHDHRHAAGPARAQRRHDPHPGPGRCRAAARASCRG